MFSMSSSSIVASSMIRVLPIAPLKYAPSRLDENTIAVAPIIQARENAVSYHFAGEPTGAIELSESGLITPKLTTPAEGDIPFPLGTDTIIVRVDDGSGTYVRYPVRVISNVVIVSSITIQSAGQSVEVENGKTFNLAQYVAINPSNATDKSVTYSSQDETVATVDPNGVITVIGEVGPSSTGYNYYGNRK